MLLALLAVLAADPGLHVYRSRAELPKALAKTLPKDFDFKKEMLAGDIDPHHELLALRSPASSRHDGKDTWLELPPRQRCPPCMGINHVVSPAAVDAWDVPVNASVLWRVPLARGRVFVTPSLEPQCAPCLAP